MSDLFRKLNLRDQASLLVLDPPASFEPELAALDGVTIHRRVPATGGITFAIAFVQTLAAVERVARQVVPRLDGDAILWCAYPKGSSKRYRCEFSRDTGWAALGSGGLEPVRLVAIDDDWSALRFRRAEYIATMRRDPSRAMSATGKARTSQGRSRRA